VLLLHGGGQTRGSWRRTALQLAAEGYQAITLDARGHGDSDWAERYTLMLLADDLRAVMAALPEGSAPPLIGASLGGMTALVLLGSDDPPPCSGLVLVDIAPKTRPEGTMQIRAFMMAYQEGFASVEEAADAVAEYMTDRPRPSNVDGLRRNLRERDGRFYWHWDPRFMAGGDDAESERRWRETNLDACAARITIPTLLIRGEHSQVIDQASIDHTRALMPQLEVSEVAGAGHMVAGDANSPFAATIRDFLRAHYPAR
jgi:pimeloyl-ACP methyl ester carboxylesterase